MPGRVLIAYDGSPAARSAVHAAAALLPGAQARVVAVYQGPVPPPYTAFAGTAWSVAADSGRRALDEIARAAAEDAAAGAEEGAAVAREAGLDADGATVLGESGAWRAVLDAAREFGADVVVSGTRGQGAFARSLLGSTSSSLLHHADRPVLVVPEGAGSLAGLVVVGFDGSDSARAAVPVVARLFAGRELVVVHAWESPVRSTWTGRALGRAPMPELREMTGELDETFTGWAKQLTEEGVALAREAGADARGETVESEGGWRAIAGAARSFGAAAIAVGARGHGGVASALLGSVSSGLVHNAELPVLVVPSSE